MSSSSASLVSSTQFLRNVLRETSAICQKSGSNSDISNQIPTVELRDATSDETDLAHFIQSNCDIDQDPSNIYSVLCKELHEIPHSRPSTMDKIDLLMRVYDKANATAHIDRLCNKRHYIYQSTQEIEAIKLKLAALPNFSDMTLTMSSTLSDMALLKEEAELDRLELQISKIRCTTPQYSLPFE